MTSCPTLLFLAFARRFWIAIATNVSGWGHNAQEFARRTFAPERAVRQLAELFSGLMARPKRLRAWPDDATDPAAWFIAALGDHAGPFAVSYGGAPGSARGRR
jgi:hypothetical protein